MEIKVNVNGQKMKLVNSSRQIVAGSQEFILIKFTFSSDWDGLSILAKFAQEGNDIDVIVENGQCYFPRLIGPGKCILSVVGIGTSKVATADTITFDVKKSYSIGEGGLDLPYDESQTLIFQMKEAADTASEKAAQAIVWAEDSKTYSEESEASANSAAQSAQTATTKASEASASASIASTKAQEASQSEINAGNSADAASTKASEANTSATNASESASAAASSATTAGTKATEASGYASNALTSKEAAQTSATNAAASATLASNKASQMETQYNDFLEKYAEIQQWYTEISALSDDINDCLEWKDSIASGQTEVILGKGEASLLDVLNEEAD